MSAAPRCGSRRQPAAAAQRPAGPVWAPELRRALLSPLRVALLGALAAALSAGALAADADSASRWLAAAQDRSASTGPAPEPGPPSGAAGEPMPHQILVMFTLPALHLRADGGYGGGAYADPAGRTALRRAAEALARRHGLRVANSWPMPVLGLDCYVMDVPAERAPAPLVEQLAQAPGVAWAQVSNVFRPLGAHTDPLFALQPAAAPWHVAEAHERVTGRGVTLALIDSGVQVDHPDLAGQVAWQRNFVGNRHERPEQPERPELHGTAVAGIIAARPDDGQGIAGIAPGVRLLALRACWQLAPDDTRCTSLSLALALQAAIEQGAQVVNLSLSGPPDRLLQRLVEAAQARGAAVVAALDRSAPDGGFPASLAGVVAAADADGGPVHAAAAWLAPGTDVPTSVPVSRWATVSGASYAAAHVGALLALMQEARARRAGAPPSGPLAGDLVAGAGHAVDACASLGRAALACICACGSPADGGESVARH